MVLKKVFACMATLGTGMFGSGAVAFAQDVKGRAIEKQLGFQDAVTETMRMTNDFHNTLLWISTIVTLFVFALLAWTVFRYSRKRNPNPSKTSHNMFIEIVWTLAPVLILMVIAVPSFRLLYYQDVIPEADMSINITGNQWYWTYEYPDYDNLSFDANMLPSSYFDPNMDQDTRDERDDAVADIQRMLGRDEAPEIFRLLDTDVRVVVPVNKTVKIVVTAADVLHSWAMPSFGVKIDTVPGRTNEQWFRVEETGTYYGQCSELCGIYHAFMPIVIEVVTEEEFEAWLARAKSVYATDEGAVKSRLANAE